MASTRFRVNDVDVTVAGAPDTALLYVLRNDLGLKGTRFGCGQGLCGACMVLADDRAIFSCDTPVWSVAGKSITTIEKIVASEASHALIDAFIDEQAGQCGYCLSGIIVKAEELLRNFARPTRAQIAAALEHNLCRCGTHVRILNAIERAALASRSSRNEGAAS
jgi:nicotinate dehydrogenase subunit A